jgi:hypothetical protein
VISAAKARTLAKRFLRQAAAFERAANLKGAAKHRVAADRRTASELAAAAWALDLVAVGLESQPLDTRPDGGPTRVMRLYNPLFAESHGHPPSTWTEEDALFRNRLIATALLYAPPLPSLKGVR